MWGGSGRSGSDRLYRRPFALFLFRAGEAGYLLLVGFDQAIARFGLLLLCKISLSDSFDIEVGGFQVGIGD
ncbi:hypothetical protein QQ73_14510, partial [Candidatus Endoriftia persephone str. Guaymas]|nr:hypothetical protein [Candidatus Endoriftia persephone str. Guaymas]